jgi:cytochrome P450
MTENNVWRIEEQNGYRFPPGLRLNLPLYLSRRFFRVGNPILLFEHLYATYGRMAHYRVGPSHIVLVSEPEFIREILINQAQYFVKERTQKRMKILLGEGLITSDGEIHSRQRRIVAPAFHRQRIQAYASIMVDCAVKLRDRWNAGREIDASSAMMSISLEVVARTLFAQNVTPQILSINHEVNVIMELYNFLIALPRAEGYLHLPIPGLMRFRKARKRLDAVVYQMIRDHRHSGIDKGDLLSMLLRAHDDQPGANQDSGMTDEQLRDEVLTIFLAGYETVSNALAWTWLLLAQNPEAEAKLHAELDRVLQGRLPALEDLPSLRYTEMVLSEAMRLYPPAWAMGRQATRDVDIGPYRLPAGTFFFFSQYIIQRSPENFPEPLRFDPERFTPENKARRSRFVYFPFGAGHRQCIGESFAWMEASLVLVTLAQRWRLRLVPNQIIEVQPKITLRPKYGIKMLLERRAS